MQARLKMFELCIVSIISDLRNEKIGRIFKTNNANVNVTRLFRFMW